MQIMDERSTNSTSAANETGFSTVPSDEVGRMPGFVPPEIRMPTRALLSAELQVFYTS
jgi:hypothetical protein